MPTALVRPACYLSLVTVWIVDLLTPQLFVAAIFMNVPIALSSLVLDEQLTRILVALALAANISAGYANGLAVGAHWDAVAVGDRIVSGFSFFLVGVLTIASQRSARRAGELSERNERTAREQRVSTALQTVRASMSIELVERSIVREALAALESDVAWFIEQSSASAGSVTFRAAGGEVEVARQPAEPAVASLIRRVLEDAQPVRVEPSDAFGRLVLATLDVHDALAAPVADAATQFGVVIVGKITERYGDDMIESVRSFASGAASALAQSALFEQLAGRNDELAAANANLSERTDVIRDIVYALSHDLRTPLTAAGMTMRQALDGRYGPLPAPYRAILEQSIRSNDELQRLAETLLLVSKYESGEGSQRRELLASEAVVHDVIAELTPLALSKRVTLKQLGDGGNVLADPSELRRAIVNFVANAIAWSREDGTVTISTRTDGSNVRIDVEDEGFGVPAGLRDRLFERMVGESRSGAGSGLGLYIVSRIAHGHGGSVSYQPRPQGGSRFSLTLPLAKSAP